MSTISLQDLCNRVVEAGRLTGADLLTLSTDLLADGITNREQADLLLALERAVETEAGFADFLIASVVNFAVWGERPTGFIDRDAAEWLTASIRGRRGPTETGARIAMEIAREAEGSNEALLVFALEANRWTQGLAVERPPFARAA